MQLFNPDSHINFMAKRKMMLVLSTVLIAVSIASFFMRGFNFGIDFTGGTLVEVQYAEPVDLPAVRDTLKEGGFDGLIVQYFGTSREILIRIPPKGGTDAHAMSDRVFALLEQQSAGEAELRRVEFVGPQVGEDLREKGGLAMLFALVAVLIYVALRFEIRFAVASILAIVHDVILTLGFFSLTQTEFDLTILAAVLAVIGYSLNDTIVVFDRIRENFRRLRKVDVLGVLDTSINQMLGRTLMTSFTTMFVVLALFFLGGEIIHGFSLALLVGIVVGTYSSIYVASPTLVVLKVSKADLMPVKKEGEDLEAIP